MNPSAKENSDLHYLSTSRLSEIHCIIIDNVEVDEIIVTQATYKIKGKQKNIDNTHEIQRKDAFSPRTSKSEEYKNHLFLTPKYKTGNICQNIIQYYDKNGFRKVDEIFQDDMFDFIYYIIWLKQQNKPPLHFTHEVSSNDQKEILRIEDTFGINRFKTKWATSKDSDTKRRRYSAVNKKLGYDLLVYEGDKFQLKGGVDHTLNPFPDL